MASPDAKDSGFGNTQGCSLADGDRLKKGDEDPLGDTVDRILVGTDRFIIYSVVQEDTPSRGKDPDGTENEPNRITKLLGGFNGGATDHVWLRTKYPRDYECAKKLRASLGSIAAELAYICDAVDSICRSGSLDTGRSNSLRRRATEMMARAMEMAYEGNETKAEELLDRLRKNITTLRDSKNRMRYVQGNLIALASILVLWLVLRFNEPTAALILTGLSGPFDVHVLDILALGAIGAFFAVSASVSSIRVDHSVTFWEMLYTGFVRIPIGVIAAGVIIFLMSGGWLLASIEPTRLSWTYLLLGFLAGFSELFVPNALRQVEAASTVAVPSTSARTQT